MSIRNTLTCGLAACALAAPALAADKGAQQVDAQKQQAFAQGPSVLAGTITAAPSGGQLQVTPYGQGAPITLRADTSAPVFQGNGTITQAGLAAGTDVRVHYKTDAGTQQATAIEVLPPKEAQLAKQQATQQIATATPQPAAPPPATPSPAPGASTPVTSQAKQDLEKTASGSQAGKVISMTNGVFMLDPYQKAAGNARLSIDPNAPVFQGDSRISTSALVPGNDVRVFFSEQGKEQPKVVAVEVLDKQQAQDLEKAERDVPKQNK